jgi:hypothetical protein
MRPLRVLIALLLLLGSTAGSAFAASTAADLCAPNADPCQVSRALKADDGSVFDVGDRALEFGGGGRLDVGTGSMTIIAKRVKLEPNSRLLGRAGNITVTTSGAIEVGSNARIDVSDTTLDANDFPGSIRLQAGGDVVIEGEVDAHAAQKTDGGVILISGAAITIGVNGHLNAAGGGLSTGGIVGITAQGALGIAGPIEAQGGDSGGSVEIDAASVATSARIDVSGGPQGGGAILSIQARGPVVIGGVISGEVDMPGAVVGTAAEISIFTEGGVELNESIVLTGGIPFGEGGSVEVDAGGDLVQRGPINVSGRGIGGTGGEVTLTTRGALTLADIDVSGATAGTLTTQSFGGTHITRTLGADASDELSGTAGTIDVSACTMDMDTTAVISSVGLGGTNHLSAGGQMVIRGTLVAGDSNLIEYQNPAVPPVVSGSLAPTVVPELNPGLDLCTIPGGTSTTLPGNCGTLADFDGLLCRLAALTATLGQSPDTALGGRKAAKKIKKMGARATTLVEAARDAKAKKQGKKLKGAGKQIASFLKVVRKGQEKGKIDAALAGTLTGLGDAVAVQIGQLRSNP